MRPELFAIRVDGQGDVSSSHVLWNWKRQVPEIASPILVRDSILFVSSLGVVTCLSQNDGTMRWQDRLSGSFSASPTAAGDLVYLTNQSGITSVIRSSDKMETLATNELFGETLASFAIFQDGFLIRTHPELHLVRKSDLD
jgi:outer membrane protein assembly factor BamB